MIQNHYYIFRNPFNNLKFGVKKTTIGEPNKRDTIVHAPELTQEAASKIVSRNNAELEKKAGEAMKKFRTAGGGK